MTRSALENLHWAFVDRAIKAEKDWAYVDALGANYPNIGWIRHIRNDLLHNRLLPIDHRKQPATIDRSLLPTSDRDKDKAWHTGTGSQAALVTVIDDVWNVFPQQMNTIWLSLDAALTAASGSRGYGAGAGSCVGMGHGSGASGYSGVSGTSGSGSGSGYGSGSGPAIPPSGTKT